MLTMINSKEKQNNRDTSLGKKETLSMGILPMLRKHRERKGSFSHMTIFCVYSLAAKKSTLG